MRRNEPACTNTDPMQPASHHCSHTRTASLHTTLCNLKTLSTWSRYSGGVPVANTAEMPSQLQSKSHCRQAHHQPASDQLLAAMRQ